MKNKLLIFLIFVVSIANLILFFLNSENNKLAIKYAVDLEISKYVKDIIDFYNIIPKEKEIIKLVSELPNLAKASNLKISSIRYEPFRKESKSSFKKLSFSIPVDGSYADIREFIYRIENLRKLIRIESISLRKEREEPAIVGVELYVSTYFR